MIRKNKKYIHIFFTATKLKYLPSKQNTFYTFTTIVTSTHIVELADELEKIQNISFHYLGTYFKDEKPVFTYQLKEGISKERMGLYIMQNEGIIEIIRQAAAKQQ